MKTYISRNTAPQNLLSGLCLFTFLFCGISQLIVHLNGFEIFSYWPRILLLLGVQFLSVVITYFSVAIFSSMTTTIDSEEITNAFKWGFPSGKIKISDIESIALVERSMWWGLGVRWIKGGTIWRSWGNRLIEITKKNGKNILIGSEDPEGLLSAISFHL
jgi:hypothetical protein